MTDIKALIKSRADKINAALEGYLAALDKGSGDYRALVDAMCYAALGGGKRVRPFLVYAFCAAYGGDEDAATAYACAIELIHSYSLVHDDLPCMDNDDMRRGRPSTHKAFGEACALLAGDALLTYAFEVASSSGRTTAEQNAAAVLTLSRFAGPLGMAGGQALDLALSGRAEGYEGLLRIQSLKTGALFRASCRLGVIAAGGTDMAAADAYAENVGIAFQICDDLLEGEDEADKANGRVTALTFLSREEAREKALYHTNKAIDALPPGSSDELAAFARLLAGREY